MPTPGRQILAQLRQRLDRVRDDAARVRGEFVAVDRRMEECVAQRGQAVVELARHDLPDMSQASIERTFAGIRDELQAILARKERAQTELNGRLERCRASVAELQQQADAVSHALSQLNARRQELEQSAAERLRTDSTFQELSQQAISAEMQLKANEERAEELQLEAADKLPAYQRSRLFTYLYERRFGKPEYGYRGWTRSLDRWLARLIEFDRHQRGYEFLRRTPPLVAEEVARRRAAFHALMEQVEAIEDRVTDDVGLTALLREGEQRGAEQDRLRARLAAAQQQVQQVEADLTNLDQQQSSFYREALDRYTRFLAETETAVLQSRARETADPVDDEIVARIAFLTQEIERLKPEVAQLSARSREAEQRTEGLSFVVRRAEQAGVDSDRCTAADPAAIARDLDRYVAGAMSQNDLWSALQRQLHFEPTWVETTAAGAGQMLNHPASHVLLQALAQAASVAIEQSARGGGGSPSPHMTPRQQSAQRSVQRRAQPSEVRRVESGRPSPSKGFWTRGGF